jgi:hypothetical protein
MDTNIDIYYKKYKKYKTKYLRLKELRGGVGFCHNNYKIFDVGKIVNRNIPQSRFLDYNHVRTFNNEYKENIDKIYNELKIMLKDLKKYYYWSFSTNLIAIDKKIDEIKQKYNYFIDNYSKNYKQEELKTDEQSEIEVKKFTEMLNNNITIIKKLENEITEIIKKINKKEKFNDLIIKINSYFEKIYDGLRCSKPIIIVTNLVTSQKQYNTQQEVLLRQQQPLKHQQQPQNISPQTQYLPQPQYLPQKTSPQTQYLPRNISLPPKPPPRNISLAPKPQYLPRNISLAPKPQYLPRNISLPPKPQYLPQNISP